MKVSQIIAAVIIFSTCQAWAQGYYEPLTSEHHTHFYGSSEGTTKHIPLNSPWYVFSDRENNPVYNRATGSEIQCRASLGNPFLVIGKSGKWLYLIDAHKIKINMVNRTWVYRDGFSDSNVIRGWMDEEKLLLSNKCLKVRNSGVSVAPIGIFDLQGLLTPPLNPTVGSYKLFSGVPGGKFPDGEGTNKPAGRGGIGYVYKITEIKGKEWCLMGREAEISDKEGESVLTGWRPKEQIIFWKNRLALEYNWEGASNRSARGIRLGILRDPHPGSIPLEEYRKRSYVDRECDFSVDNKTSNYYFQRASGSFCRNVIIEENQENLKVGVIKNPERSDEGFVPVDTDFASFIPGYVSLNYNFLGHQPFKYVVLLSNKELENISNFASRISELKGYSARMDIQKIWKYMLINQLDFCKNPIEADNMTISEATSILIGFKGSSKYDQIKIGDILSSSIFTSQLMDEYIFEWKITLGYLRSVISQRWQITPSYLTPQLGIINAIRIHGKKSMLIPSQMSAVSKKFGKKDNRNINDYFRNYPCMLNDTKSWKRKYWVETDFFSHEGNDFVEMLLSVDK